MKRLVRSLAFAFLFSGSVIAAEIIDVAIYRGPGVGGSGPDAILKTLTERPSEFTARFVTPEEIRAGILREFDAVIFPGGSGSRQAEGLGGDGREVVREFVRNGGGYLGICAGCYLACENYSWSLKILDAKTKSQKWKRGTKVLELGFTEEAKPLLDLQTAGVKYANGPVMEPAGSPDLPDFTTLAIFKTETAENDTPAGIQVNSPAILSGTFGKGRVVGVSPHPEQSEGLEHVVPRLLRWSVAGE